MTDSIMKKVWRLEEQIEALECILSELTKPTNDMIVVNYIRSLYKVYRQTFYKDFVDTATHAQLKEIVARCKTDNPELVRVICDELAREYIASTNHVLKYDDTAQPDYTPNPNPPATAKELLDKWPEPDNNAFCIGCVIKHDGHKNLLEHYRAFAERHPAVTLKARRERTDKLRDESAGEHCDCLLCEMHRIRNGTAGRELKRVELSLFEEPEHNAFCSSCLMKYDGRGNILEAYRTFATRFPEITLQARQDREHAQMWTCLLCDMTRRHREYSEGGDGPKLVCIHPNDKVDE